MLCFYCHVLPISLFPRLACVWRFAQRLGTTTGGDDVCLPGMIGASILDATMQSIYQRYDETAPLCFEMHHAQHIIQKARRFDWSAVVGGPCLFVAVVGQSRRLSSQIVRPHCTVCVIYSSFPFFIFFGGILAVTAAVLFLFFFTPDTPPLFLVAYPPLSTDPAWTNTHTHAPLRTVSFFHSPSAISCPQSFSG